MADSYLIPPAITVLKNISIERISSEQVQKSLPKQGRTSILLEQLNTKLLSIKLLLADAERKETSFDESTKHWLDDLRNIMYDAENTLDLIDIQAFRSKSSSKTSFKKVQRSIFSCIMPSDERIDTELVEILKRLDATLEQASVFRLQGAKNNVKSVAISLNPKSKQFVGRDLELKKLTDFMNVDEFDGDSVRVVLISGLTGVGKTALADMLYKDERLGDMFDVKAWLQFQTEFGLVEVFKGLYQAMVEFIWSDDLVIIEKKLCDFIKGKRLLLVFDDVCFQKFRSWDELLQPIRLAAKGTTVIVSTCNDNASSLMHPSPEYSLHLKPLSDEDCWSIIKIESDGKLEAIGKQIGKKCEGLPLATVMIEGALRSIPQEIAEWEAILKNRLWESSKDILPALRLSYDYLYNPELKLCFAYCSLFPKKYRFEREKLVLLWMAEGFLASNGNQMTPEELGRTYFNELVSRSFFQQMGNEEACFVMHNLTHDLAISIFEEITSTRHFSYVQTKYHDSGKCQALSTEKLRTFLAIRSISNGYFCYIPRMVLPDVIPKWSFLRVLSLSHYQITELPSSVENLRQLRYLDLSFTRITKLPNSIRKLYMLQTLLLSNCGNLSSLPTELANMTLLRHLDITNTDSLQEMPYLIGKLKNLQTLTKFALGHERGSRISELNQFQSLQGTLTITRLENVESVLSAKAANIKGKIYLDELVYQWHDYSKNQTRILDELKPHVNLKRLTIHGFYGTTFPDWVGAVEYQNMVVLTLTDCCFCISLPPLGQLSSLKHVSIEGFGKVVEVGPEFYGTNTPFPSLETLKFKNMSSWRKWKLFQGKGIAFPKLEELYLVFCTVLSGELPTNLPLLRKLDIRYYPEVTKSLQQLPSIQNLTLKRCSLSELHIVKDLTLLSQLKINTPGTSTWSNMQRSNSLDINPCIEFLETKFCNFETLCHAPSWLRSLTMGHCRNLALSNTESYRYLRYLSIIAVDSLASLHLNLFPNLIYLEISSCQDLESISAPEGYTLESLHDLFISDCQKLTKFPLNGLPAPKLTRLTITGCNSLKLLPERMSVSLVSLRLVSIENCPEIDIFPPGGLPTNLITLKISGCTKLILNRNIWRIENLVSLKQLEIGGDGFLEILESFPDDQFLLPESLNRLSINGFKNLKSLNYGGIQRLTSLEELKISGCPKLEHFPEDVMLPSLCSVEIFRSPQLELRCFRNKEDWPKISHLPRVRVVGRDL